MWHGLDHQNALAPRNFFPTGGEKSIVWHAGHVAMLMNERNRIENEKMNALSSITEAETVSTRPNLTLPSTARRAQKHA